MGINSNEAVADLNEEVTNSDSPELPEGFADLSQAQKQDYLNRSMGTSLDMLAQPRFQYVNVPYNLKYKLRAAKIGVEVVDVLTNLAVYDSNEKILKIRKDADLEHVQNYIEDVVLPDLEVKPDEKPEEITPPTPLNLSGEPEQEPQTESQPAPEPVSIIEPTPEQPEPLDADKEEQAKEGSEWKELERLRFHLARAENQKATTIGEMTNLGILRDEYEAKKQKLANVLREKLTGVSEGPLTKDQQKFVNDTVFDELVQKENEAYLTALKENRSETWKDKGKEALRTVAGLKLVSWYLKQNKWTRVAVNTGLFGIAVGAGTFIGGGAALTAMGATAFRGARAAGSVLGSGLGATIDKKRYKQIEQVNEEERNEVEEIKNNENLSLEEKTKKYTEAKEKYDKERKWITKRKAMFMVGGGVLAGSATGGLLDMYYGSTGGSSSVLENKKGGSAAPDRMPRGTFKPGENVAKTGETMDQTIKAPSSEEVAATKAEIQRQVMEESKPAEAIKPEAKPEVVETKPETPEVLEKPKMTEVPEVPKMSFKPEELVHEVKAGDSTWSILKEVLKHDERFKNLSGTGTPQEIAEQIEAKQTRVLHDVLAKSLKNHDQYNIGPNGEIKVGDKVDFSKLFNDPKELDEIIKDAENLKPTQISSIVESNRKIETWLKENSGKKFDLDEIMSTKPKVFVMPKPEMVEPELPKLPEAPELTKPPVSASEEILEAKKRLGILEDSQRLRTMSSDTLEVAQNAEIKEAVEGVLKNEVNDIYGQSSFLGLKKVAGVDTKEWKTIAGLPARRVLEYFKSPETSDLPKTILAELQTSEKHRKLVERITELVVEAGKHSNADFDPKGDESIVDYLKRIGGSLMRQQIESRTLKRAA